MNSSTAAANGLQGLTLDEIPKSNVFTTKLPPDPAFPTPESSATAPRDKLGPRPVKEALYTFVCPEACEPNPELLSVSPLALRTLGLSPTVADDPSFLSLVSGNSLPPAPLYPWAHCYGGWQFGVWAGQLGDGRAVSLFEVTNPHSGERYELQLKGAGKTPYSRFADGKAVLRSSIREFIVSEYLHAIGIPTTRALSLTLLPSQKAVRERIEPCAVVCRFAESWVRIGSFDLFRWRGDKTRLRILADYVYEEVLRLPEPKGGENKYLSLYRDIVMRNAKTVAAWQAYGFQNGTSVMGLSLDFGPFAFMDTFDRNYTPNHDDHALRYSYQNQPTVIWWNLVRLGEDLAELIATDPPEHPPPPAEGPESEAWINKAEELIVSIGEEYKNTFLTEYKRLMALRLGLKEPVMDFFSSALDAMGRNEVDFHQFFRVLSEQPLDDPEEVAANILGAGATKERIEDMMAWIEQYTVLLEEQDVEDNQRIEGMLKVNPRFVPRSWVLDEVIRRVEKEGDREVLGEVLELVMDPFGTQERGKDGERWCGEVPLAERGGQCSCSS